MQKNNTDVEIETKKEVIIENELTIDSVLDKINVSGIKSLTDKELQFLKNVN